MTTFFLIRHGNTTAGNKISGRDKGYHLSENGQMQVKRLGERLANVHFDAIYCSPMERTQETAKAVAEKHNIEPKILDKIIEVDFGDWTGKSFDELESIQQWKLFHIFRSGTRVPNGEHMIEIQMRMVTEIERLRALHPDGTVAIVSHGDPIRTAIVYYAGMPMDFMLRLNISTGHTLEEIVENTGFEFDSPRSVPETPPPTPETLKLMREVIAPQLAEVYPQFAKQVFGASAPSP
jgi:probable phosphoglycerate mutase